MIMVWIGFSILHLEQKIKLFKGKSTLLSKTLISDLVVIHEWCHRFRGGFKKYGKCVTLKRGFVEGSETSIIFCYYLWRPHWMRFFFPLKLLIKGIQSWPLKYNCSVDQDFRFSLTFQTNHSNSKNCWDLLNFSVQPWKPETQIINEKQKFISISFIFQYLTIKAQTISVWISSFGTEHKV